ncbi:MAG: gliding motility-associated C-terminal domain-containing protein [Bacteroidota bacterium]
MSPAWAQVPITAEVTRGCAPFTVELDSVGEVGLVYLILYNNNQDTSRELSYTYTEPGTDSILVVIQRLDEPYYIPVIIDPPVEPEFEVFSCANNQVRVELVNPLYDEYQYVFDTEDTIRSSDPSLPQEFIFPGVGNYEISVQGNYTGAAQNCPVATTTLTTRDALAPPVLTTVTAQSDTELQITGVLAENTEHRLETGLSGPTTIHNQEVSLSGNFNTAFSVPASSYHCTQLVALDACSGDEARSELVCTASVSALASQGVNALQLAGEPITGATYTVTKNGNVLFTGATLPSNLADVSVECNELYEYQVQVEHPEGGVSFSQIASVVGLAPSNPESLTAPTASVSGTAVELIWNEPMEGEVATHYIYNSATIIDSTAGDVLAYSDLAANADQASVCYAIGYQDVCQGEATPSDLACSIFLQSGATIGNTVAVQWTPYVGDSVISYRVLVTDSEGNSLGEFNAGISTEQLIDLGVNLPEEANVVVVATLSDGATQVFSNVITISFTSVFGVPNAFTPDGDDLNDVFQIKGSFLAQGLMEVYNRWGELVYRTENAHLEEGWDGQFANQPAPTGIYSYYVRVQDINGNIIERRGRVFLLREQ